MRKIIFYDGECPLCNRAIRFILKEDKKGEFFFAPLNGKTAEQELSGLRLKNPNLDTLVLLEDGKIYLEGKGALRILWHLGGKWLVLGWLSFLPPFLLDALYRLIARNRYRLFSGKVTIDPQFQDRFLP